MATDVDQTERDRARRARVLRGARRAASATRQQRYYAARRGATHVHGVIGPARAATRRSRVLRRALRRRSPTARFEVLETVGQDDRAAVRWRARGNVRRAGQLQGFEPNGARRRPRGRRRRCACATGAIARNDAYIDGADARAPARPAAAAGLGGRASAWPRRFNPTHAASSAASASDPEPVADGVWVVRGGFPVKTMNVYFVRDGDGVLLFDAGIKAMTNAVARRRRALGGITRVVLGHGAPRPPRRRARPRRAGLLPRRRPRRRRGRRRHRTTSTSRKLNAVRASRCFPRLLRSGTAGRCTIAGTVAEGDEVAGFEVVHLPGHAPGLIGLWRESDRLALVSDCFYTLDPQTGRHGHAARAARAPSTTTPSRRAPRSASSRRWSRRPLARPRRRRSPATCAAQLERAADDRPRAWASAAARAARSRSSARPRASTPSPQGDVLVLRGALTPKTRAAVRTTTLHGNVALPGGRLAARGRVPVRAPGRALGRSPTCRPRASASC